MTDTALTVVADFTSTTVGEVAAALAKAQATFPKIERKRSAHIKHKEGGGSHSYTYADLADVNDAIRKPLAENALCVVQPIVTRNGSSEIVTRLIHSSGEWIESNLPLLTFSDPKQTGAVITYFRRYALCALLNIASEEDTDGPTEAAKNEGAGQAKPASEKQVNKILAVSREREVAPEVIERIIAKKWPESEGQLAKLTGGRDGQASHLINLLEGIDPETGEKFTPEKRDERIDAVIAWSTQVTSVPDEEPPPPEEPAA